MSNSSGEQFLRTVIGLLNDCGIQFMVTGSFVSSHYGDPRTTRDLDVVVAAIEPPDATIVTFVERCEALGWYVSRQFALEPTVRHRRQFNVIDSSTGWKLDVMWRENRAFSIEEFSRRTIIQLFEINVFVPTPEDIVLAKLEWTQSKESRQFADAVSVLRVNGLTVDHRYLAEWAAILGIEDLLRDALDLARS